jgi:hypothetical protein
MKIHGNFQNLEMCEATNGVIQVDAEHWKEGIFGRRVRNGACLRFWKHMMHYNNENWFGNFFSIYPTMVRLTTMRHT